MVRFPLIFISGVFLPLDKMPVWGKIIAPLSPLTYAADLIRYSFQGQSYYSLVLDFSLLGLFSLIFLISAIAFHAQGLKRGI